jgi:hypothetical protein
MPDNPEITVSYPHLIRLENKRRGFYEPDGSKKEYKIKQLPGTINKKTYNHLLYQLKERFSAISELAPQQRGFEFEKFLNRMFKLYGLKPRAARAPQ